MFPVFLKPGVRFKLSNKVYVILKLLSNGLIQVQDERFCDEEIFKKEELIKFLDLGIMEFEAKGKNVKTNYELNINTKFDFDDLEYSKYKETAIFRFKVIQPLLDISDANRKRSDIEDRVNEVNELISNPKSAQEDFKGVNIKKVSATSVYRWLSEYKKSEGDLRSLIPGYHRSGGKNKPRLSQKIVDFIIQVINENYLTQQRITMREAYYLVINLITDYNCFSQNKLNYPSLSTFTRYISKIPEYELVAKRIGKKSADQLFGPVGKGVLVERPLERVEIDTHVVDVILLGPDGSKLGRPYLVAAIDKYSRYIVGMSLGFGGVGWPEVMQCIRHILKDKSYIKQKYPHIDNEWTAFGVPGIIIVDNGLEYKNNAMKDACFQLNIVLEFAPPRVPEWKGSIERFFETSNTGFTHNLPGTTRSNPRELGDDEDPSKMACLPYSVFLGLINKWIVDVYSQELNKGAGGIPAKMWAKGVNEHPIAWPNSTSQLAILLGRVQHRKITNKGIEIKGLYYNSIELNKLLTNFSLENDGKNQKFKIKYNPHNLGEVFIYDHLLEHIWVKVPAVYQEYAENLSEWEHDEIRAFARKEFGQVDIVALAKSKQFIRDNLEYYFGFNKKKLAKAKDVMLSIETNSNCEASELDLKLSPKVSNDISDNYSDFGENYFDKEDTKVITFFKDANADQNLIPFKKKSRKKKVTNDISKTPETSNTVFKENLSPEDLIGIKVFTNLED